MKSSNPVGTRAAPKAQPRAQPKAEPAKVGPEVKPVATVPLCELENCQCEKKELEDLLKRLQAEFENYRKRVEKDQVALIKSASCDLISRLLPFLDSFEQALKNVGSNKEGLELLHKQLMAILASEGLEPVACVGKPFDPYLHEVMLQEQKEGVPDEEVTDEIQKGYQVNGRVIRHAKVKINRVKQ